MSEQALTVVEQTWSVPDAPTVKARFQAIAAFQHIVHQSMVVNVDYGTIPGTQKPTLLKPGAEKIAKLMGLHDHYEITDEMIDWDRPLFSYTVRCTLFVMGSSVAVSEGMGECNSYEDRYRWRWVFESSLPAGFDKMGVVTRQINTRNGKAKQYRLPNDEPFSLKNTILKMAKKRALVDAALSAGRLSDLFTQDMEDIRGGADIEGDFREVPPDPQEGASTKTDGAAGASPAPTPAAPTEKPPVSAAIPAELQDEYTTLLSKASLAGIDTEGWAVDFASITLKIFEAKYKALFDLVAAREAAA